MNIFDRKGYDSEFYSIMSLGTFISGLHIYVADLYSYTPHRGLRKRTPADVWEEEMSKGHWPAVPPNLEELLVLLSRKFTRCLEHYGVDFMTIRYQNTESAELYNLRKRVLQFPAGERNVTIKVNPSNLGRIFVYDHLETKTYIPLVADDPEYAEGLSLWAHQSILDYQNAVNKEANEQNRITRYQARKQLQEKTAEEFETTKSVRKRQHDKRFFMGTGKPKKKQAEHPYAGVSVPPQAEGSKKENNGAKPQKVGKDEQPSPPERLIPKNKVDTTGWGADFGPKSTIQP